MYGHLDMCEYIQGSPVQIQTNTLQPDRSQRDRPPLSLCYRPAEFFPHLRLIAHSLPKQKFGALLENVTFFFITENLRTSGSVRT
jgi:hypothetical protein